MDLSDGTGGADEPQDKEEAEAAEDLIVQSHKYKQALTGMKVRDAGV